MRNKVSYYMTKKLIQRNKISFALTLINMIFCLAIIVSINFFCLYKETDNQNHLVMINYIKYIIYLISFISIYINFFIIINNTNDLRFILYSIGAETKIFRNIQFLYIGAIALICTIIGMIIGLFVFKNYFILIRSILLLHAFSFISLFCILYKLNSQKTINKNINTPLPAKIKNVVCLNTKIGTRFSSLVLGFKYILSNIKKVFIFIVVLSLMNTVFVVIYSYIEMSQFKGAGRKHYKSDYTIDIHDIKNSDFRNNIITEDIISEFKNIEGVKRVIPQYSIFDSYNLSTNGKKMYNYYAVLKDNDLTFQSKKFLELCNPLKRSPNDGNNYVMIGISAFDKSGLDLVSEHLIEGSMDYDQVINQPIVFLPKYIDYFENGNLPYTNLNVGDIISVVETNITGDINKEYHFTIGGYLDNLVFDQYNGVSNGFVLIMSNQQLMTLSTEYKFIVSLHIDVDNKSGDIKNSLEALSNKHNFSLIDNSIKLYNRNLHMLSIYKPILLSLFIAILVLLIIIFFLIYVSNIIQRQQEYSCMNILGITKSQILKASFFELLLIIASSYVIGCLVGITIIYIMNIKSNILTLNQIIPWDFIMINFMFTLFLFILIMLSCYIYIVKYIKPSICIYQ